MAGVWREAGGLPPLLHQLHHPFSHASLHGEGLWGTTDGLPEGTVQQDAVVELSRYHSVSGSNRSSNHGANCHFEGKLQLMVIKV